MLIYQVQIIRMKVMELILKRLKIYVDISILVKYMMM